MAQKTLPGPGRQPVEPPAGPTPAARPGRWASARRGGRAGWPRTAAAVAAGLVMWPAFPPLDLWPLAPLGVAALTLTLRGVAPRTGAWLGLLAGAAFFLPVLTGIMKIGPDAWVVLSLVQALYFAPLGAGTVLVLRLPGWPAWAAAMWVAEEFIRGRWPFGGFPWARLAFSQADSPYTGYAALGGAPLVSFLVALTGTLLAYAIITVARVLRPAPGEAAGTGGARSARDGAWGIVGIRRGVGGGLRGVRAVVASRRGRGALLAVAGGVVVAAGGLLVPVPTAGKPVTAAVIQGNVPRLGLDFLGQRMAVLNNHVRVTHQLAAEVRAGKVARPEIVIWPENSSDLDPYTDPDARAAIDGAVRDIGVPVLVGALVDTPDGREVENRGIVWDPRTGPGNTRDTYYVKRHPVPFGEYLPFRDILTKMITRFERVPRDFTHGGWPGLLRLGPVRIGDVICFEVAYDGVVRDAAAGQLLVVQTNNATYGRTSLPPQQLAMSRLRAVEHGRSVLVAATSGISAIIRPDGTMVDHSREFTPDIEVATIPARTSRTLADRLGALPEWGLALAAVAAAGAAVLLGRAGGAAGAGPSGTRRPGGGRRTRGTNERA